MAAVQMYKHEMREEVRTETVSSGPDPMSPRAGGPSNLSELDTLLQDLKSSKHSTVFKESSTSSVNGGRPCVNSLLDELNNVEHSSPPPRPAPPSSYASPPQKSASNATRELDDLMASLSDFKDQDKLRSPALVRKLISASTLQSSVDPSYAKPHKASPPPPPKPSPPPPAPAPAPADQLDSMLGNLAVRMTEQGIHTQQKGCCCACDKPIVGQVITALGKTWHPDHFTCAQCHQELGTQNFFERDGKPYCEEDYHKLFSPKCSYCSGPILDKCVTALNTTWHPEHFFCAHCGENFGDDGFHEKDGKPYCKQDYYQMFAPKCGGCNAPIRENYISALNAQWHPECFVCRDCKQSVSKKSFYEVEKKPVCGECLGVSDEEEEGED